MTGIEEIKDRLANCQSELKKAQEYLLQLKEARDKILNDITVTQARIDTFNGAIQAFDLSLKATETTPSVVPDKS